MRRKKAYVACHDPTKIPCVPGLTVCFKIRQLCLYDFDETGHTLWCRDGAHLGDCSTMNCTNSYKCPESYCIPFYRVCDGNPDCIYGEDEVRCDDFSCKGLLRCMGTNICVHPEHICDGINHCPTGDDETSCDMIFCLNNCSCFSSSIICFPDVAIIPIMPTTNLKHLSITNSHIPIPNLSDISDQTDLLFLNLSRNHIQNICSSLQIECKFYEKRIHLDISNNEITFLWSNCFKRLQALKIILLGQNPLHTLRSNALSLPSVSFIDIRHTSIKSLNGDVFHSSTGLYKFDISGNLLEYLDSKSNTDFVKTRRFKFWRFAVMLHIYK